MNRFEALVEDLHSIQRDPCRAAATVLRGLSMLHEPFERTKSHNMTSSVPPNEHSHDSGGDEPNRLIPADDIVANFFADIR